MRSLVPTGLRSFRLLALFALLALLMSAATAAAHASLTGSEPEGGSVVDVAPKSLSLSFNEPVSPLRLTLVRPDGTSVPLTGFALRDRTVEIETPPGLGRGTHVLSWHVVSEDGHPIAGSVVFSIGEASPEAPLVDEGVDWSVRIGIWATKIALYAGLFFGIGGIFARRVVMPGIDGGRYVAAAALAAGIAGACLSVGFQGLDALGAQIGGIAEPVVWSTGFGTTYGWTVAAAVLASFVAAVAIPAGGTVGRFAAMLALLGAGLALALSGHASAASPQRLMRPMVFLHAVAIAIWIGGLLPLALAMLRREPGRILALKRFSKVIPGIVAVLVFAGLVLAIVQVEVPAALFDTDYGAVLLIKLFLLVCLFALAAINRWSLTARVEAGETMAERRLVRSVAAETLLVLLILGAVAAWRFTPPPRVLAALSAEPVIEYIQNDKALAYIQLTPGRVGKVDASVNILTSDFEKLDAREVALVLSKPNTGPNTGLNAGPNAGIEPVRRKLTRRGEANWRDDIDIPISGLWRIRVDILVTDAETVQLEGQVMIRP